MMKHAAQCLAGLVFICGTAMGQGFSLSLLAGVSQDMRSQTEDVWKMGLNIGAHGFLSLPGITVGGRISYHRWGADGVAWLKELDPNGTYTLDEASGTLTVFEVAPSVRLPLITAPTGIRIEFQGGVGIFFVGSATVTVKGSFNTGTSSGQATFTATSASLVGFGPEVAVPVTLGGFVEIVPVYSAYNAGGSWYHHYAINMGFSSECEEGEVRAVREWGTGIRRSHRRSLPPS